jgi:putative nucleotidyltransferase with HDIG domain
MNAATQSILTKKVNELNNLPAMPSVLIALAECLSQNAAKVDVSRVVELISCDESLAMQCLRVANSALFRRRNDVETVRDAVLALGLTRIRDLVYSCSLPKLFFDLKHGMPPVTFWRHAMGTALISQHFAKQLGVENYEKLYLAGLLHDIGILVNYLLFPEEFHKALVLAQTSEIPLWEAEQQVLGFTHCESGGVLADFWKLPPDIAEVIEFHHQPALSSFALEMTAVVYLADLLCRLRGLGYGYYEARQFDLASEPSWQVLAKKHPVVADLDLVRFTFELEEFVTELEGLVDSILGASSKN